MMMVYREGSSFKLREIEESDWKDVHRYACQEIVCHYQPWGPNNEEESKSFVKQAIDDAHMEPRSRFVFAIVLLENGNMIGAG